MISSYDDSSLKDCIHSKDIDLLGCMSMAPAKEGALKVKRNQQGERETNQHFIKKFINHS